MDLGTVVFGTVFMDCKGFAGGRYDPFGRNVGSVKFIHGGVGRNVAENLANIGVNASFVSSVDANGLGTEVLERLAACGTNTDFVKKAASHGMGMWLVIIDENGDLAGSISQMPDLTIMEEIINGHGDEIIRNCASVVLEIDLNEEIASKVLKLARKYAKKCYGITGNMEVVLRRRDLLRELECYICNETEAARLLSDSVFPADDPEAALRLLKDYVEKEGLRSMIITLGSRGSIYYDGRAGGFCPAIPTITVDTTGAGDAYFSGVTAALERGMSLREAAMCGTRLASWTIGSPEPVCREHPEKLFK